MSCRSTRSRSTRIVVPENFEQTRKITDVFKVTRGRGRSQKKILNIEDSAKKTEALQTAVTFEEQSSGNTRLANSSESVCSPPKRAKKINESSAVRNVQRVLFTPQFETGEVELKVEQKIDKSKSNILPTHDAIEIKEKKCSLLGKQADYVPSEKIDEGNPEPTTIGGSSVAPLLDKADELAEKLCSSATQNKAQSRIRTVAELQALLAEKSSLRKIHEQSLRNKTKQVEEHAHLLKSPIIAVPIGRRTVKEKTKQDKDPKERSNHTAINIPEYVLPTHLTPAKNVEDLELKEERHVFDYGRASRLVDEVKCNSTLPLPLQYERLLKTFQSCDRVVSIYTIQGRRCVVSEIQKNVEKNTQIGFTHKNLAQIVHVYPTSYDIHLEKCWTPFGGESKSSNKFDLIMAPNLNDDLEGFMLPDTPTKSEDKPLPAVTPNKLLSPRKKVVNVVPRDPIIDSRPRLEGWRMTCRSYVFRYKLAEIVKKYHRKFVERIGLVLSESDHSKLRRFHPKFDLDAECKRIPEAKIPDVPKDETERQFQMRDYFATVDTSTPLPSAVNTAIDELKSPVKKMINSERGVPLSPRRFAEKKASKSKESMSLLDRIRAKEAAKKAADNMRDPLTEKKIELLQRILHGLLRCITTYFAFKKVRSLEINLLFEQITRSQSSMNRPLVLEHIAALCEVAPDYVTLTEVAGKKYLQLKENNYTILEKIVKEELARIQNAQVSQLKNGSSTAVKKSAVRVLF